jgi:hypothetical protein
MSTTRMRDLVASLMVMTAFAADGILAAASGPCDGDTAETECRRSRQQFLRSLRCLWSIGPATRRWLHDSGALQLGAHCGGATRRKRVARGILVAGIVGLSSIFPMQAKAQLGLHRSCPINSDPNAIYDWLDTYWRDQFQRVGEAYHSPQIQLSPANLPYVVVPGAPHSVPRPVSSLYKSLAVLPDSYKFNQIQYLSWRTRPWSWIQYDDEFYNALVSDVGGDPFGPVAAFAHEWGHHAQNVGGRSALLPPGPDNPPDTRSPEQIKQRELDADRLAGSIRSASSVGTTESVYRCYEVAVIELLMHPDPTHGSGPEREACFYYGFRHGPDPFYSAEPAGI